MNYYIDVKTTDAAVVIKMEHNGPAETIRKYYAELNVYITSPPATGSVTHKGLGRCWSFCGIEEFVSLCDRIFDGINMPQRTGKPRSYNSVNPAAYREEEFALIKNNDPSKNEAEQFAKLSGETPTFVVKVLYRQNASWQGTVQWVEKGKEVNFRSALELLMLMNEAVGVKTHGWNE